MPDGTPTGDSLLVEASDERETRRTSSWSTVGSTLVVASVLLQRKRAYEVWETRVLDGPYRGRIASIPAGMVFDHYENSAAYDQGTRHFLHLDVFAEPHFGPWEEIGEGSEA